MVNEVYELKSGAQKKVFLLLGIGLLLLIAGIFMNMGGGHGHGAETHEVASHHGSALWLKKLYANLWLNNIYFLGIAIIGVFFVAIQYVAQAGWFTVAIRIPMSFGWFIPLSGVFMLLLFFIGGHDLFHWTHEGLYIEGGADYDAIIAGKTWFLTNTSFIIRIILFIGAWTFLFMQIRNTSISEDLAADLNKHRKIVKLSAIFLVVFAVTSSIGSWDWIMSIDTHWFSTLFGWYMFASWLVSGIAMIILVVIFLKEAGYLKYVNSNHLHDMGKFLFGFSIFWTYLWFSQFFLYWYANIPEEVAYYQYRFENFKGVFFINLILNFLVPFLVLMTRDAKRLTIFLKVAAVVVLFGHWLDFYLMIMPGTIKADARFGLIELGSYIVFLGIFLLLMLKTLSKASLVAKNHPMLDESLHHHI